MTAPYWEDDTVQLYLGDMREPIAVLMPLIEYACPPGGLVIDPFAGSGSTLEAARLTGRRAIGIERHEPYAEAAAKRLAQAPLEIA